MSATANGSIGTYTGSRGSASGVSTGATYTLTNTVGAAKTITATAGSGQSTAISVNFATALVATVTDAGNNPVSGVSVSFAGPVSGASATFSPTTALTNAQGQVTVTATANAAAGSYTVTATATGVSTGASYALTNNVGTPKTISMTAGSPQSTGAGAPFANALVATMTEAGNNPLSGVSVTFAAPSTGASATLNPATAQLTNAQGQVTVSATANVTSGTYSVIAAVSGVSSPAIFILTNNAGVATTITATGSSNQNTPVTTMAFPSPLVATVTDANNNPVSGVSVTFSAPTSGATATLNPSTAQTTNALGQVTVTATAGTKVGAYPVIAIANGVSTGANFLLFNTSGSAKTITATSSSGSDRAGERGFWDRSYWPR